jgi:hypothetical protein
MKCERCQGSGLVPRRTESFYGPNVAPCPECNGQRIAHCCDGLREQPANDDEPETYGEVLRKNPGANGDFG